MAEFRYNGLSATRKKIIGTLSAKSKREAANRVGELAKQHNFTLVSIERKKTYEYKVHKKGGVIIHGEQEAFSKEELELALRRMGFDQIRIQPKLFDFKLKPPYNDVIMFIRLSADLLRASP
jgi:type IV pilus assembly protein PilC